MSVRQFAFVLLIAAGILGAPAAAQQRSAARTAPPAAAPPRTFTFLAARDTAAWFAVSGAQKNGDVVSADLAIFYAKGAAQRQGKPVAYMMLRQDLNCPAWTTTFRTAQYFGEAGELIDTETAPPAPPSAIGAGTPGDVLAKLQCRGETPNPTFQASSVAEVMLQVRGPPAKPGG